MKPTASWSAQRIEKSTTSERVDMAPVQTVQATGKGSEGDTEVVLAIGQQREHFRNIDPPRRGVELPDGIILRHTL
jgi:hypothetical protein